MSISRRVKDVLRATVGRNVLATWWWRVRYFSAQRVSARFEDAEVARLARTLPNPPEAMVTVLVATYKRPEGLRKAVHSALNQTVRDIAVVVVDDGGGQTDGLPDDPRLTVLTLSANHISCGLSRNVAMRLSRSPYVAVLDDDNTWRPEHLEHALAGLADGSAGLVYTRVRRVRPDGSEVDVLGKPFDRRAHADDSWVDANSLVFRRRPGLRFNPWARPRSVHPKEDWEFVHHVSAKHTVRYLPVTTVEYSVHSGSYFSDWDADALGACTERVT
ncbi:hypothetical protein GCM10022247_47520 [Allokutzneria multivorans]|uniref:Glycosyltransferase 2-like domain-containing protein n=1 Tax=Allokutzneria multivorans TaxID=1142134 RepID=A0ABP7SYQ0_9PSEU